ncbi:unnamed protein product [Hymenolepis diminuta]|uniref:Uncharacterized protein n=1 Tax=Hymenolepis diminuta TaxID=6216 RepID=A0A564YLI6_HYMDI|nr:unnamed protein product [Hymenolepis diminuta]
MNLYIKCDSGMNQQNFDEHNYVNPISSETMSQNVSTLRKTLTEYWLNNNSHFVRTNRLFATSVATEAIRRQYDEINQISGKRALSR